MPSNCPPDAPGDERPRQIFKDFRFKTDGCLIRGVLPEIVSTGRNFRGETLPMAGPKIR
jgi:hypothetical protein